jgi:hypothetical protein
MSHRAARTTGDLEVVAVLGAGDLARLVGQRSGQQIEGRWELVRLPGAIELPAGVPLGEVSMLAPMVGLLLENVIGLSTLDFANPRRAPNTAEIRRRRVLLGALGAILVGGGAYVTAQRQLSGLQDQLDASTKQALDLQSRYDSFLAEHARMSHIERWSEARVDWLAYLDVLNQQLPDPKLAVLDGLGAQMRADILYTPKGSKYPDGNWAVRQVASFSIDGKMSQRAVAADLRGKLLDLFENVGSKGPDVPDRFSFELETSQRTPRRIAPLPPTDAKVPTPAPAQPATQPDAKAETKK